MTTIDIEWSDFSSEDEVIRYEISYTLHGETPDLSTYDTSFVDSYTFENLLPASTYQIRIRTVCDAGNTNWSTPAYIYTEIDPSQSCDLNLQIDDNSCGNPMLFRYPVSGIGDSLGINSFIREVRIAIQHDWPSDIECSLVNPAGDRIILFQDKGIGSKNIGKISNACLEPLQIDRSACNSVNNAVGGLRGSLKPQGDILDLYENFSNPNGDWFIELCDDANGQVGTLKTFEIVFEEVFCEAPENIGLINISDTSLDLVIPSSNCDSVEIVLFNSEGIDSTFIVVPCENDTIHVENLTSSTAYTLLYQGTCSQSNLSTSCPSFFETFCSESSLEMTADNGSNCIINCADCNTGNLFTNTSQNQWKIGEGSTNTDLTGPSESLFGIGKYLYVESSEDCSQEDYILQSTCLQIVENIDCNFSFYYNMNGSDIGTLTVELSLDSGSSWFPMWELSGSQSQDWTLVNMELDYSISTAFQIRFRASNPTGDQGDVAIDNIRFAGIEPVPDADQIYYRDQDEDGYGSNVDSIFYCGITLPTGYVSVKGDCNDENELINPESLEFECNGIDDNCNSLIDEDSSSSLDYELIELMNQTCNSIMDGTISLEPTGGIGPYTIQWNTGQEEFEIDSLQAGLYFATISDAGNCTIQTDTFTVELMQSFDFLISVLNKATCLGYEDGSIEIFHDEDNGPYTYIWSSGQETKDIENVDPGPYNLQITDVNGCIIETGILDLGAEKYVDLIVDSIQDVSCTDLTDGYASIAFDSSYASVMWEGGSTDYALSNLGGGIYGIEVIDSVGCKAIDSIEIQEPLPIEIAIASIEDVSCFGENDGFIEVQASGGSGVFNYIWNEGTLGNTIDLLTQGVYEVSVTDENECEAILGGMEIEEPISLVATIMMIEKELCTSENGAITLKVEGGSPEYNYAWSNDSTSQDISNLTNGIYDVTVTDRNNCRIFIEDIEVEQEEVIIEVSTNNITDIKCFDEVNGAAALVFDQVTDFPLSVVINDSLYEISTDSLELSTLTGGVYDISGMDLNGCLITESSFTIDEPTELQINLLGVTSISCGEEGGRIEIGIQGGIEPYDIDWSNGENGLIIDSLDAGLYTIEVEDSNSCADSIVAIEILSSSPLVQENIVAIDPLCFGEATGQITVEYSGGEGNLKYELDGMQFDDGDFSDLGEGMYLIIIKDSIECNIDSLSIDLEYPAELSIMVDSIAPAYCGNANGYIGLNAEGGTGELTYNWSGGVNEEGAFAQNLSSGLYDIIVLDANNCGKGLEDVEVVNIDKDISIVNLIVDSTNCFNGASGSIIFDLEGEVKLPLEVSLNDSVFTYENGVISNVMAGNFDLLVIDADGCEVEENGLLVESPEEITYSYEVLSPIVCHDDTTGSILMMGSGGTGSLDYLWNNNDDTALIDDLGAGYYRCAIVDERNCIVFTDSIYLENPDTLIVEIEIIDATNNENNGAIYVVTTGGVMPYEYNWNYDIPSTADTIEFLTASEWFLNFVDGNGCMFDTTFTVQNIVSVEDHPIQNLILYPNPTEDFFFIDSHFNGLADLKIYNEVGQLLNTLQYNFGINSKISIKDYPSGVYYIRVEYEGLYAYYKVVKM